MTAFVLEKTGEPLARREVPRPEARPGHVLVRVAAASVNPLDVKIRDGAAAHARVVPPAILGIDLAGVVAAVGTGVTGFAAGDEVYGMAGGVGHVAVQVARSQGATVFATGSGASLDVIRGLGAHPIDRTARTPQQYVREVTGGAGFDVIVDTVGGTALDDAFASVRRYTGHVVSILGWGAHSLAPLSFRGASYSGVFTLLPLLTGEGRARNGDILREAAALADAGALTPILHPQAYDRDTVAEAYDVVGSGSARGKVVIALP